MRFIICKIHRKNEDGTLLATVEFDPDQVHNPDLIVKRETKARDVDTEDMRALQPGEKLTLLQCDPKPGDLFVLARRNSDGSNIQVIQDAVKPIEAYKGATQQIALKNQIK